MVANRESIAKVGLPLCRLIIDGQGGSAEVMQQAKRLKAMLLRSGTYRKKYSDHEQRVLHRHLNLYKNKLAAAKTDAQRQHWQTKLDEQRAKVRKWEADRADALPQFGDGLDVDGL